jgi:hypothetical protein
MDEPAGLETRPTPRDPRDLAPRARSYSGLADPAVTKGAPARPGLASAPPRGCLGPRPAEENERRFER